MYILNAINIINILNVTSNHFYKKCIIWDDLKQWWKYYVPDVSLKFVMRNFKFSQFYLLAMAEEEEKKDKINTKRNSVCKGLNFNTKYVYKANIAQ